MLLLNLGIDGVLPGEPWVAGGLQLDQDGAELLAGRNFIELAHQFASLSEFDILFVALTKFGTVEFGQIHHFGGVKQIPVVVFLLPAS